MTPNCQLYTHLFLEFLVLCREEGCAVFLVGLHLLIELLLGHLAEVVVLLHGLLLHLLLVLPLLSQVLQNLCLMVLGAQRCVKIDNSPNYEYKPKSQLCISIIKLQFKTMVCLVPCASRPQPPVSSGFPPWTHPSPWEETGGTPPWHQRQEWTESPQRPGQRPACPVP